MGMTTYLANKVLDHVYRNATYTPPTTIYLGLFTSAPSDAGGGTEVSAVDYDRVAVTVGTAASRTTSNTVEVDFGTATSDWAPAGTPVTHGAIFDAATAGNMLDWGALTSSKIIQNGDPVSVAVGELDISIAANT